MFSYILCLCVVFCVLFCAFRVSRVFWCRVLCCVVVRFFLWAFCFVFCVVFIVFCGLFLPFCLIFWIVITNISYELYFSSICPFLLFPTLKSNPRLGVLQGPFPLSPPLFPLTFTERVPQPPRRRLVSIRVIVDRWKFAGGGSFPDGNHHSCNRRSVDS